MQMSVLIRTKSGLEQLEGSAQEKQTIGDLDYWNLHTITGSHWH